MRIGPLLTNSPFTPYMSEFQAVMNRAGLMSGSTLRCPLGVSSEGVIKYGDEVLAEHFPMVSVMGQGRCALEIYGESGGRNPEGSAFLRQASRADEALDMTPAGLMGLMDERGDLDIKGPQEGRFVRRILGSMPGRDFRGFSEIAYARGEGAVGMTIGAEDLARVAEALVAAAIEGTDEMKPAQNSVPALYRFIAGLLYLLTTKVDYAQPAADNLVLSAGHMGAAGDWVASGIVAELAGHIERQVQELMQRAMELAGDEDAEFVGDDGLPAFAAATGYWHRAARAMIKEGDRIGLAICVYRGLLSSVLAGPGVGETRYKLLMTSASLASGAGMFDLVGDDHMRIAALKAYSFDGKSRTWIGIADAIDKAVVEYERADLDMQLVGRLKKLSAGARAQAEDMRFKLQNISRHVNAHPRDVGAKRSRGLLRLSYGDLVGAVEDLENASNHNGKDADLISELALAHHFLGHFYLTAGASDDAYDEFDEAMDKMDLALRIAGNSEVQEAIVQARMGALFLTLGERSRAIGHLSRASELAPADEDISNYLDAVRKLSLRAGFDS